jgi:enamine deaminase RidA (YjgF/YER057c/UK114 family)
MIREVKTANAAQPFSNYAQAIAVEPSQKLVFVSGQVGADADGIIAVLPEHQHEHAWQNVLAILAAEGMDHRNIVDAHVYITDAAHIGIYREVRDRVLQGHRCAATLLIVAGLAHPAMLMEVSVTAAAPI